MTLWPRHWPALMVLLLALAAALPLLVAGGTDADGTTRHVEWPTAVGRPTAAPAGDERGRAALRARFPARSRASATASA